MNRPRVGRPRDRRIDRKVTGAALEVLADSGFEGFSVEEVAARADVAKSTIYRRFPSRNDLLVGALERLNDDFDVPPPSLPTVDRLVGMLTDLRIRKADASSHERLLHVVTQHCRDPELSELITRRVVAPRRAALLRVLNEGVAAGELRADLDLGAMAVLLVGSMIYLGVLDQRGERNLPSVASVVRTVIDGASPT